MSYAQTANRANPAAMLGALGVPGAFGAVLVIGLAVTAIPRDTLPNPIGVTITPTIPDDPPPPVDPVTDPTQPITKAPQTPVPPTAPVRPDTAMDMTSTATITTTADPGLIDTSTIDLGIGSGGSVVPEIEILPDPISASPRNNPGGWVTNSDYRSSWINREWAGVAGFSVTINEKGRVSNCTITKSTGHSALDAATCKLVERRARFEPAKDSYGNPTSGTYRSSVNWQIPE